MEPTLPPAPVQPEITPSERREMKGIMPNVAPAAASTKMEKKIMTAMEEPNVETRPRIRQSTPPSVCTIHNVHNLPRIPKRFATMSESTPPNGREKKLASPNVAPIVPAKVMSTLKRSKK